MVLLEVVFGLGEDDAHAQGSHSEQHLKKHVGAVCEEGLQNFQRSFLTRWLRGTGRISTCGN